MKYVILKQADKSGYTRMYPVIFPEFMTHSTIAHGVQNASFREEDVALEVHSAGFCNWHYIDQEWIATRGSESLNVKRAANDDGRAEDEYDARILNMPDAMQGLML
jgi:hypothetical protein